MKIKVVLSILIFLTGARICCAQVMNSGNINMETNMSMDTDIRAIRSVMAPAFNVPYDDYLQYSPGLLLLGLKSFGYESRSGWGRMFASGAFSAAIMGAATYGLKEIVSRTRPDGSDDKSFPSGHAAKSFALAAMLHKEYAWRSPWISFTGYTLATATSVGRLLNDKHWMSDVIGGAAIGIGAVNLGYWISDLIFSGKHLNSEYMPEHFDPGMPRNVELSLLFSRRFIFGDGESKEAGSIPYRGSSAGIQADCNITGNSGVCLRANTGLLIYKSKASGNMYGGLVGSYWNFPLMRLLELQLRFMIGYSWNESGNGLNMAGGTALSLFTSENYKISAFAEFDTFSYNKNLLPTINLGYSASFFW